MSKPIFQPSDKENIIEPPKSIIKIDLPLITTRLDNISNSKPNIHSEKSVTLVFTHEQRTILSIDHIDINRVSETRSSSRKTKSGQTNYTVSELRNIAHTLGIKSANLMKKHDLAITIKTILLQLKSTK